MRVEFDASGVDFEVIVELSEHADAFELSNNTVIAINPDEHFMERLHELNIPHKVSKGNTNEANEIKMGQEGKTSAHFIAIGNKAYRIFSSCDAFILAFSDKYEYAEDMKKAIENRDIKEMISIIASAEDDVKRIEDYQRFLREEIDHHVVHSLIPDYEYVEDLDEIYEEVENVYV